MTQLDPWQDRAACRRSTVDFFPRTNRHDLIDRAKAVCADCPVASECADYAEATGQEYGVWAGVLRDRQRSPQSYGDLTGHYMTTERCCAWCSSRFEGYGVMKYCCTRCRIDAKLAQNRAFQARQKATG